MLARKGLEKIIKSLTDYICYNVLDKAQKRINIQGLTFKV